MSELELTIVPVTLAADVCRRFPLEDESRQLLREGQTPRQFLNALIEHEKHPDAIRFLAHALPKREAVWWACRCARWVAGRNTPLPIAAALQAAEKWVEKPGEESRRQAMPAAEAAGLGTPAGCAAVAAFWSGGSLGPPNVAPIPPGEFLTAQGVAGAVLLAGVLTAPEHAADKYGAFLADGIEIARGTNCWGPATDTTLPDPGPAPHLAHAPCHSV